MKKRKKPEVRLYFVGTSLDEQSEAEFIYAESPSDALMFFLAEFTNLREIEGIEYYVKDLGVMKDPDDRPKN